MGGMGSNRWTTTITRLIADGLVRLDVRALAQTGALGPGTSITVTWDSGASVSAHIPHDEPACIMLEYDAGDRSCSRHSVTERIPLLTTPGTFGGIRPWFACPGCGKRCAVLYELGGHFRCQECHHLTYGSTCATG